VIDAPLASVIRAHQHGSHRFLRAKRLMADRQRKRPARLRRDGPGDLPAEAGFPESIAVIRTMCQVAGHARWHTAGAGSGMSIVENRGPGLVYSWPIRGLMDLRQPKLFGRPLNSIMQALRLRRLRALDAFQIGKTVRVRSKALVQRGMGPARCRSGVGRLMDQGAVR